MTTTTTLILPKETIEGLDQVAAELGVKPADLAEKAIRQFLRREAEKKIEQEEVAYYAQHSQLLETYAGRFIAFHNGKVIDSDEEELVLYQRIRQQYPLIGILIKCVTSEPDEVWHMRSPRLEYDN